MAIFVPSTPNLDLTQIIYKKKLKPIKISMRNNYCVEKYWVKEKG
jgi:hypothetical protein